MKKHVIALRSSVLERQGVGCSELPAGGRPPTEARLCISDTPAKIGCTAPAYEVALMYASTEVSKGVVLAVARSATLFLGRIPATASRLGGDSAGLDGCICGRRTGEETLDGS